MKLNVHRLPLNDKFNFEKDTYFNFERATILQNNS